MQLMVTSPHSGEIIPSEAVWLMGVDPRVLLTDVDRFVHEIYGPICLNLKIPFVAMNFHRYVLDLNRLPTDIDANSVEGAGCEGQSLFVSGYHWVQTTEGHPLLTQPISRNLHDQITRLYFDPFHQRVSEVEKNLILVHGLPRYHLDVHSMPSVGRVGHRDSGEARPDIVISDCSGKSSSLEFKDLVVSVFKKQGFRVAYNWPYLGGRMVETYGRPSEGRHSLQVELNRSLYMDEKTKEKGMNFAEIQKQICTVVELIAGSKA